MLPKLILFTYSECLMKTMDSILLAVFFLCEVVWSFWSFCHLCIVAPETLIESSLFLNHLTVKTKLSKSKSRPNHHISILYHHQQCHQRLQQCHQRHFQYHQRHQQCHLRHQQCHQRLPSNVINDTSNVINVSSNVINDTNNIISNTSNIINDTGSNYNEQKLKHHTHICNSLPSPQGDTSQFGDDIDPRASLSGHNDLNYVTRVVVVVLLTRLWLSEFEMSVAALHYSPHSPLCPPG